MHPEGLSYARAEAIRLNECTHQRSDIVNPGSLHEITQCLGARLARPHLEVYEVEFIAQIRVSVVKILAHAHQCLIECQPGLDVATHRERPPLADHRQRLRVAITEALGERVGTIEIVDCSRQVARGEQSLDGAAQSETSVHRGLGFSFEERTRLRPSRCVRRSSS